MELAMKTVFVVFDTLNRLYLEPYGGTVVKTPNFNRLAERTVTFDNHYVGSMPCMPARRDMQTGRLSFLHRSWGPMEPYDNSFCEVLKQRGVYSHMITDHYHYFEDGGSTYHTRYNSFDFIRGQECDPWKVDRATPIEEITSKYHPDQNDPESRLYYHNMINREQIKATPDFPSVKCFDAGLEFLDINRAADDWLLQIETFDPHEPFTAPKEFREDFPTDYDGPIRDWPAYRSVVEPKEEVDEMRANYLALLSLCDQQLGRLLDYFDEHDLWKDTALIVTTDHGFLLGEHNWWAKNRTPLYEEISHIPLFVHHPDTAAKAGQRRKSMTQNIDLMPTFCDWYGAKIPKEVIGQSIDPLLREDKSDRKAVMFGYWGGGINICDGRYTYYAYPEDMRNQELYQYTLMPCHMTMLFTVEELEGASLAEPFSFTKNLKLLKVPHKSKEGTKTHSLHFPEGAVDAKTVIYDLQEDPGQENPLDNEEVRARLNTILFELMAINDCPKETLQRMQKSLL